MIEWRPVHFGGQSCILATPSDYIPSSPILFHVVFSNLFGRTHFPRDSKRSSFQRRTTIFHGYSCCTDRGLSSATCDMWHLTHGRKSRHLRLITMLSTVCSCAETCRREAVGATPMALHARQGGLEKKEYLTVIKCKCNSKCLLRKLYETCMCSCAGACCAHRSFHRAVRNENNFTVQ